MEKSYIVPISVSDDCCVYPERKHLTVVQEVREGSGLLLRTTQILIPWSVIEEAQKARQLQQKS